MKITIKIILLLCFGLLGKFEGFAQDPNFHIYLCFGQSNMEGMGTVENQDKTTNARVKVLQDQTCGNLNRTYGTWYTAVPPLNRCWAGLGPADYFGKTMDDGMPSNITIGLVNTSLGGCDIAFFQKGAPLGKASAKGGGNADIPAQFTGGYAWMLDLAKKAQTAGVIKGIIFHQGETNTNDVTWKTKVNEIVTNLRNDLGIGNVPFLAGELLYAQYASCCSSHNTEVNKIPGVVSNSHVISASGLPGKDEAHFTSASYRTLGIRYAQKMLTLVNATADPAPSIALTAPANNSSVCFGSPISIAANASVSSGSISKVDFYNGTTLVGTDNTSPFSYTWNNPAAGTHTIRAISVSSLNVSSTPATVTVTINPALLVEPFMLINAGSWSAQSAVMLCSGDKLSIGPHPVSVTGWTWKGPNNFASSTREIIFGNITTSQSGIYTATYKDANGCSGKADIPVTVNLSPSLSITSPANNATLYTSAVSVNVTGTGINNVRFFNGSAMLGSDATVPYSYILNNATNGAYTVNVKAISSNNCTDSATVKFNVSTVTGFSDNEISTVPTCFPNPFTSNFMITAPGNFNYSIYNETGMEVENGSGVNSAIAGNTLPEGCFIVNVISSAGKYYMKMIR